MNFDNNMSFVIFKPDTVYQGLENSIWSYFDNLGFEIIKGKYKKITKEQRKLLYKDFELSSRTNWDLGTEFYELGQALHLIIRGDYPKSEFENLSDYISRKLKGHFIPQNAEYNTIRGKYNSLNPVFNLLHSSDDTEAAQYESSIFFEENELINLNTSKVEITELVPLTKQVNCLNFFNLFHEIKLKLLDLTKCDSNYIKALIIDNFNTANKFIGTDKQNYFIETSYLELEIINGDKYLDTNIKLAFDFLMNFSNFKNINFKELIDLLEFLGIFMNTWEKYLLKTSLYYIDMK